MGALALWLKSKFLGNSMAWIFIGIFAVVLLVIVIPNLEQIKEKLGFETRASLKVKVEAQKEVIEDITASNTNLQTTLEAKDAIEEVNNQALEEQANALEEAHRQTRDVIVTKTAKIRKVKAAHKASNIDPKVTTKEVSRIQIQSIWATYCQYNANSACATGAST